MVCEVKVVLLRENKFEVARDFGEAESQPSLASFGKGCVLMVSWLEFFGLGVHCFWGLM